MMMSADLEQEVHSSRSVTNNSSSKQQVILKGDDSSITHVLRSGDVDIIPSVASSVSLASGRGSTSTRVTSKPISKREWDLRNPTGHIIAVSSQGRYLAYVIRGPAPGQPRGLGDDATPGDRIRVCNRRTASKGLLSGLLGSTLDLAFSFDRDQKPLLAAVDEFGCVLVVRVVENEQQTVLTFQPIVSVFPNGDASTLASSSWRRVVWSPYVRCIDMDSVPDLGQSLIVTSDMRAELWRLDIISRLAGGRQSSTDPLLLNNVTCGRYDVTEHQLPVTDAVLSCDGEHLIVGTTSLDGYVNFLQLDAVDEASENDAAYNVSVLQHWRPHNGRPVYSLCFLDNVEEPLSTMWKYALTLSQPSPDVNLGSAEIKLWHCQTWDCLQTLTFQPVLQTAPSLRLQLSLGGDFAFLTDVNRAVLYLIHLEQSENSASCASLTELLLAGECLDFALLKVGFKSPKNGDHSQNGNGMDDQENVNSFLLNGSLVSGNANDPSASILSNRSAGIANMHVTGHLIAVSPKLIHELTVKVAGVSPKSSETSQPHAVQKTVIGNSSARNDGLSLSEIGRHLVTPDLLNRSLTSGAKNSPGNASTLTGVTSLPLTAHNATAAENDDQSRPNTGAAISLFPGGISLNSPHMSQSKVSANNRQSQIANSTANSASFSPQQAAPPMVIHNASVDQSGGTRDVVGMLFAAANRFNRGQQQQQSTDTLDSAPGAQSNRLHRPSPPPSDTSLEVADILTAGRPVGTLEQGMESDNGIEDQFDNVRINGNKEYSSTTPQLLAPGALLGSVTETVNSASLPVGRAQHPGSANSQRTPQGASASIAAPPSANLAELAAFRETVTNLLEGQRQIVSLLSNLSDRIHHLERSGSSAAQLTGSTRIDSNTLDSSSLANQLGEIIGRQATSRIEMLLSEAISDCRNQLDATGRQAVADVKSAVAQQVAERVHASMDVFRHALQGVVTSRPVVDAVAAATAEAAGHAVASSSRDVFNSTVLPAIDRSVHSMLAQLGDTLAQGTAQYEQRLRANLETTVTAHQAAIQQQYSNIESTIINRVDALLERKFGEHLANYDQRNAESQKALQAAVLRSISERMETLAKQTASTVDQAVAGAVARSRPVTPAPTPVNPAVAAVDFKRQISEYVRRAEWNSAFQTALSATDLSLLVWLCQQVPIATIFKGMGPCPLSQAVLLSFIQQMSYDLTTQSDLKADWLTEAIMALDVSEPLVARNFPAIARGADSGIERYLTSMASAPPGTANSGSARVAKSLRMAQSIIRSLQLSTGGGAGSTSVKSN